MAALCVPCERGDRAACWPGPCVGCCLLGASSYRALGLPATGQNLDRQPGALHRAGAGGGSIYTGTAGGAKASRPHAPGSTRNSRQLIMRAPREGSRT
jgi:hypothetical protein